MTTENAKTLIFPHLQLLRIHLLPSLFGQLRRRARHNKNGNTKAKLSKVLYTKCTQAARGRKGINIHTYVCMYIRKWLRMAPSYLLALLHSYTGTKFQSWLGPHDVLTLTLILTVAPPSLQPFKRKPPNNVAYIALTWPMEHSQNHWLFKAKV